MTAEYILAILQCQMTRIDLTELAERRDTVWDMRMQCELESNPMNNLHSTV